MILVALGRYNLHYVTEMITFSNISIYIFDK